MSGQTRAETENTVAFDEAMQDTKLFIYKYDKSNASDLYSIKAAKKFCALRFEVLPTGVIRDGRGKPFFKDSPLFLSISHSADYIAVAVSRVEVGVDVQRHRKCHEGSISRRFFHFEEAVFISRNPTAFFDVWAAKESYVKYTGEGIVSGFRNFSVVGAEGIKDSVGGAYLSLLSFRPGYSLALTAKNRVKIAIHEEF